MKKRIISLILVVIMLLTSSMILITNAATFTDVAANHWAINYINAMQNSNIINGYPDGTFRPENKVKTGEFIKMATMCIWNVKPDENLPEGTHWVTPYANVANHFLIAAKAYTYEDYEEYITREKAVEIIWKLYILTHENRNVDKKLEKIKNYSDESLITDEDSRLYFEYCIQSGLINGFEDGTLRPNDTLTRAQATKLLYIAK